MNIDRDSTSFNILSAVCSTKVISGNIDLVEFEVFEVGSEKHNICGRFGSIVLFSSSIFFLSPQIF